MHTNFEGWTGFLSFLDKTVGPRIRSGTCPPALLRLVRAVSQIVLRWEGLGSLAVKYESCCNSGCGPQLLTNECERWGTGSDAAS